MNNSILDRAKELFDGVKEDEMIHYKECSSYNSNYYTYKGYLLFGDSNDDNFTQWYWVLGDKVVTIGGSYTSDDDTIIVDKAYQ